MLFDQDGNQFNESSILQDVGQQVNSQGKYYVLWYDAKMKNYQLFIEYLEKSRLVQAEVQPILIVDKQMHVDKIVEIWGQATETPRRVREKCMVMLTRDLTDQESLLRTFGDTGKQKDESTEEGEGESAEIDLDLKKSFYYVINPDCEITDCAKIYSFLHEENIFKRIQARVCKDADLRINKV